MIGKGMAASLQYDVHDPSRAATEPFS